MPRAIRRPRIAFPRNQPYRRFFYVLFLYKYSILLVFIFALAGHKARSSGGGTCLKRVSLCCASRRMVSWLWFQRHVLSGTIPDSSVTHVRATMCNFRAICSRVLLKYSIKRMRVEQSPSLWGCVCLHPRTMPHTNDGIAHYINYNLLIKLPLITNNKIIKAASWTKLVFMTK